MAYITEINSDNFESEVLKSDRPVLVDFWAPWCGPCRMVGPVVEELSGEMNDVRFCKVNVDEVAEIAAKYGIMSIPTLIVFKNGEPAAQQVGALGKEELRQFIENAAK
ncbi:MAG: thioredoxin [Succinivibrio sp.]|jgi:thioredoxin 1|nr:thioredoxin [Succinivibrio sp.]